MGYIGKRRGMGYGFLGSRSFNRVSFLTLLPTVFLVWSLDREDKLYYLVLECENALLNECLGVKKGISFLFLSPQIGLGFKNLRGISQPGAAAAVKSSPQVSFSKRVLVLISYHSHENEFNLRVHENLFEYERISTKTRFEKEALSNSEMAHFNICLCLISLHEHCQLTVVQLRGHNQKLFKSSCLNSLFLSVSLCYKLTAHKDG